MAIQIPQDPFSQLLSRLPELLMAYSQQKMAREKFEYTKEQNRQIAERQARLDAIERDFSELSVLEGVDDPKTLEAVLGTLKLETESGRDVKSLMSAIAGKGSRNQKFISNVLFDDSPDKRDVERAIGMAKDDPNKVALLKKKLADLEGVSLQSDILSMFDQSGLDKEHPAYKIMQTHPSLAHLALNTYMDDIKSKELTPAFLTSVANALAKQIRIMEDAKQADKPVDEMQLLRLRKNYANVQNQMVA